MKPLATAKYLLTTALFVAFPFRVEVDHSGKFSLVASYALAKSGPGSDGNGSGDDGDDSEGGDDGDDGEGGDDGDDGEGGDDGDDGEGGDDGDDGEGGDDGDDGEGGDDGDDGEGGDDGDDGEGGEDGDDADDGDDGENDRDKPRPTKAQKLANGARITFSDGSREEIRDGQFIRTDRNGRVLDRRRARSIDLARMRAFFGGQEPQSYKAPTGVNSRAVRATYRGQNVEILYSNGWREEISSGRYSLIDQYGRVAASRRATQSDRNRLNRFRK